MGWGEVGSSLTPSMGGMGGNKAGPASRGQQLAPMRTCPHIQCCCSPVVPVAQVEAAIILRAKVVKAKVTKAWCGVDAGAAVSAGGGQACGELNWPAWQVRCPCPLTNVVVRVQPALRCSRHHALHCRQHQAVGPGAGDGGVRAQVDSFHSAEPQALQAHTPPAASSCEAQGPAGQRRAARYGGWDGSVEVRTACEQGGRGMCEQRSAHCTISRRLTRSSGSRW